MRIAVLGWGSLINDAGFLPINRSLGNNGWHEKGPVLPIEFARISRGNRLTLVIYPSGKRISTMWSEIIGNDLESAIQALSTREGLTTTNQIGYVNILQNSFSAFSSNMDLDAIRSWAKLNQFDAVIWTGLPTNFEEKTLSLFGERRPLNIQNIKWFLKKIQFSEFQSAKHYIQSAPPSTDTLLRPEISRLFENGTFLPEKVMIHESGHILLALAFHWRIRDIKVNSNGSPLEVQYCKHVDGVNVDGVITNSTAQIAVETNLERLIIAQGGWAADKFYHQLDEGQYQADEYNSGLIISYLPEPKPQLKEVREIAFRISQENTLVLNQIQSVLERYLEDGQDVSVFNNSLYSIRR